MNRYEITYTKNRKTFEKAVVLAETPTQAVVNFVISHPEAEYSEIKPLPRLIPTIRSKSGKHYVTVDQKTTVYSDLHRAFKVAYEMQ